MSRPKNERQPLQAYVDLIEWVRMRAHVSRGRARKIILAGALQVDGEAIGYKEFKAKSPDMPTRKAFMPYVKSDVAKKIKVVDPFV